MKKHAKSFATIGYQLIRIVKLKRRLIDADLKEIGLTRIGWQILCHLSGLAPCTQKILLESLDCDPAQLSRAIECLEKKGYILRQRDKKDKRSLRIQLTPAAHEDVLVHLERSISEHDSVMLNEMDSTEVNEFMRLLNKIEANLIKITTKQKEK